MGNDHSNVPSLKTKVSTKVSHSIERRKSLKLQKKKLKHEKFFMNHHQSQQDQNPNVSNNFLQPRVIFVSLMGLYQSWRTVPSHILFSSIFLLPLQKDWIYSKKHHYQHDFGYVLQDNDFIKLLKWKDAQNLVFWMKDKIPMTEFNNTMISDTNPSTKPSEQVSPLVVPFWRYLSVKLSQLYNPITGENFHKIILNDRWWNTEYSGDITYLDIKKELYFLTMKFKTISEILHQSNPSLNIVTVYTNTNTGLNNNNNEQNERDISQKSKTFNTLSDSQIQIKSEQTDENMNQNQNDVDTSGGNEFIVNDSIITPDPESSDNVWWVSTEYDDDYDNDNEQMA